MSWIGKLYETYENNTAKIGNKTEKYPLLPICHTTQPAYIEIVLSENGDFLRANTISKDDSPTITPCTEESAGRAGVTPTNHPLVDKLQYVAGDFIDYGGEVTGDKPGKKTGFAKKPSEPHEIYVRLLSSWCDSQNNHPKVSVVLKYIHKKSVVADLVEQKILLLDDKDNLVYDKTTSGLLNSNVRFSVEIQGDPKSHLWEDETLWESWTQYYLSTKSDKGLCFISGEEQILAIQHPKKIIPGAANAKLISANDTSGFTYRGRFVNGSQACGVGYEATQKAHNALMWLIRRQGSTNGTQSVVAWAVKGTKIPDPLADTAALFGSNSETSPSETSYTAQEFGNKFSQLINGYSAKGLGPTDDIVIMVLDSLTSGRAAIKFYRELTGSEYLERIENWHKGCCWRQRFSKDKIFVGAPAPTQISEAAYGNKVDDKLRKSTIERLLPCIVNSVPLPKDIVESCVRNVCRKHAFDNWEWEKNLGITCALYKHQNKERDYTMALEPERKTRDYLYGRLLALAESLERIALNIGNENRPTNAERLMQRFSDHPYSTWRTIELSLIPYKQRLRASRAGFLHNTDKKIIEVKGLFLADDFCCDDKLSGEYLLSYDCQRAELAPWKKSGANNNVEETKEE